MFPFLKEKTVKIRFLFDGELRKKRMTWDDLETLELMQEGQSSPRRLKLLAAHFMVDEKNQPISEEQALKTLGKLTEEEIKDVLAQFTQAIQEAAVPNASGPSLTSTPKAGSEETPPAGSQV